MPTHAERREKFYGTSDPVKQKIAFVNLVKLIGHKRGEGTVVILTTPAKKIKKAKVIRKK